VSQTIPFTLLIAEQGVPLISDGLEALPRGGAPTMRLVFSSDADPPITPCGVFFGGCQLTEDGSVQTAGTITWFNATTGVTTIDTVQFQSDTTEVPEPASILLLLAVFVFLGIWKYRSSAAAH
jgi:hypothetical protein